MINGATLQVSAKPKVLTLHKRAHVKGLTPRVITKRAPPSKTAPYPKRGSALKKCPTAPVDGEPTSLVHYEKNKHHHVIAQKIRLLP